jgi:hypothetical protein
MQFRPIAVMILGAFEVTVPLLAVRIAFFGFWESKIG